MIQHFPVLSIMVLFFGAFLIALFGKNRIARNTIVGVSTLSSAFMIFSMIKPVMIDGQVLTYWLGGWKPSGGYAIGIGFEIDAVALFFCVFVTAAILFSTFYSFKYTTKDDSVDKYYTLFLMLCGSVLGFFMTGDMFNMFVMIEIMTITAVALTAFRNNKHGTLEGAFKYLVVGSIGSSFVLIGTILMYSQLHTLNMGQMSALLAEQGVSPATILAFAMLFVGFATKAFIFPFQPIAADAHAVAPSSISVIISGVLTKSGVFGIIRLVYCIFATMDMPAMQVMLMVIGCVSMFVCVTMALAQNNFKRLLAFHSISQIGYVITAIGLASALGISGGLYHAMNHTLFKGLLFLVAGSVLYSTGTTDLDRLGGLSKKMPHTTALFLIGAFSISGIPPFNGFVSKWMIYHAAYDMSVRTGNIGYALVLIVSVVVSVMTLASFIKAGQSIFFGQLPMELRDTKESPKSMLITMDVMAGLCVFTGLFPNVVNKYLITPATKAVLNVGGYIDAMMGQGYAASHGQFAEYTVDVNAAAGYWEPISWLVLFIIVLAAFALFMIMGSGSRGKKSASTQVGDAKHATFFGGEQSEYSQVASTDLFWGFKHNFKGYFNFMHEAHSGIVNDYALWAVVAICVFTVFSFIVLM